MVHQLLWKRLAENEVKRIMLARYRRRNGILGLCLLGGVLSVYGYSMFAVKQEHLDLDDIVDPNENVSNNPALFPSKSK